MPSCQINGKGSAVIAQQLFLGSSIISFNNNTGWGGSPSRLSVELINDNNSGCVGVAPFTINGDYSEENHYYDCVGDSCYIDENGDPYVTGTSREQIVPGKVYHVLRNNNLVSKYWNNPDPGFLGDATYINPDGQYIKPVMGANGLLTPDPYSYNIIGAPVYFRFGYFSFGGFITSWERQNRLQTVTYSVEITSADSLLENSKVILDHYAGAIFGKTGGTYGSPVNYTGNGLQYYGKLTEGNIPNVFNVYGFLESYGFGASAKNDQGIPLTYALNTLSLLTSITNTDDLNNKKAFSPFGRIIAPAALTNTISPSPVDLGDMGFGLVPSVLDSNGTRRSAFCLDLSEIPRPPLDIRISAPDSSMSVLDLIRQACDRTGKDFYTVILRKNGHNIIKIKTVDRTVSVPTNAIPNLVKSLDSSGIGTVSSSYGKEQNRCSPRVMYIGGNQQRLHQAKSYILGYSQTSFVYNPVINQFVDYNRFNTKHSVLKAPNFLSTKNTALNKAVLGENLSELWNGNETISQTLYGNIFNQPDNNFSDSNIGGDLIPWIGNSFKGVGYGGTLEYKPVTIASSGNVNNEPGPTNTPTNNSDARYIPLNDHAICPFFGYRNNEQVSLSENDSNIFRYVRPVFLDRWTGQLVVSMAMSELPVLSLGSMPKLYATSTEARFASGSTGPGLASAQSTGYSEAWTRDPDDGPTPKDPSEPRPFVPFGFKITETEMRAAQAGFDEYFGYCMARLTEKPDLYLMLVNTYKKLGKLAITPNPKAHSAISMVGNGLSAGANTANGVGQKGAEKKPLNIKTDTNFNAIFHFEFIQDLKILVDFIKEIADNYYGRKYLVRLPEVVAYRDKEFADIQIPSSAGTVGVYQGSGKLYYDKELVDGAWEEYGNVIDDSIVVGGPAYYKLINDKGLIKPILGYNASFNYDDVSRKWCEQSEQFKAKQLKLSEEAIKAKEDAAKCDKTNDNDPNSVCGQLKAQREYDNAFLNNFAASIDCNKKIVPSINFSKLPSDYVLLDTNDTRQDAFGRTFSPSAEPVAPSVPQEGEGEDDKQASPNDSIKRSDFYAPSKKLYITTSCDGLAFLDPYRLGSARAIVNSPGIEVFSTSYSYSKDPGSTIISNAMIEDLAVYKQKNELTDDLLEAILAQCIPILDSGFLIGEGDTSNQSTRHAMISKKMAHPFFAGVPIKSNIFCYGPWTNYPKLNNQDEIFPGLENTSEHIEQMIADTKIEQNTDFVPWNYGGSAFLDKVVLAKIASEATFQTVMENGQVSINGTPIFGMSGGLQIGVTDNDAHELDYQTFSTTSYMIAKKNIPSTYVGLVISSINMNVSANNVSTGYTFRTFSQKLGLYSKENADRLRQFSASRISFAKKIADAQQEFEQKINSQIQSIIKEGLNSRKNAPLESYKSKIYGTSPSEMLIGKALHYIPNISVTTQDPGGLDPDGVLHRYHTFAGMFMGVEIQSELAKEYDKKAAMSMDGLYSPISFYPTDLGSTYALSSRCITSDLKNKNVICPKCNGTGKIEETYIPTDPLGTDSNFGGDNGPVTDTFPCPLCAKSKLVFSPSEEQTGEGDETELPQINLLSLNPIVVPYGEFRNPNSQPSENGERSRHSIAAIARSEHMPVDYESFDIHSNLNKLYDPDTGQFAIDSDPSEGVENQELIKVMNLSNTVNKDYYEYDLTYKLNTDKKILLNQRFFGLRGPLMLHGWGYDVSGYPVPNQADEPKELDSANRPKRFYLTSSGTNDLTRNGAFVPTETEQLGDIIGKGYEFDNGEWTKTKTKYFHLNWAERPDLWPVGPIDLRWDDERKVWTGGGAGGCAEGEELPPYIITDSSDITVLNKFIKQSKKKNKCPYKMVYITLEENMTLTTGMSETHPARAFIDDVEYSLKPIKEGYRRLVFVKDRCGYTAPRGAKLLCRYDPFSGFYEPVSKQSFIVFGSISGGNNAIIEMTYIQGVHRPENAPRSTIVFDNTRFNFTINSGSSKRGMFLFENGNWILIGTGKD